MALPYAFVTLLTSDFYLPGALALAAALRDIHPSPSVEPEVDFQTVCIVTPETLDISTIKLLRRTFDVVVGVELITQEDDKGLQLLGRPDLYTVLTKLHVFRLTQYAKIIFLDADVLPIRPLSHLFTLPHEFSAVPDVGWPDIFNSGVMVLSPAEDKFTELNSLLKSRGSWDGGDQGILNEWRGGDWNRLSFVYNTTPTAAYTYAPAYERFGSQIKAIHFIGPNKPWNSIPHRAPFSGDQSFSATSSAVYDFNSLLDRWFAVYDKHYRSKSIIPESEFAVRKYVAAWDAQTGTGAALVSIADQQGGGPSAVLGLEDLRRLAIEGMSAAGHSGGNQSGEGEYRSLPLEGRVDLMAPQGAAPSHASQPTHHEPSVEHPTPDTTPVARHHNLPTPGPDEFPPNSHPQPVPLPSHTPAHEAGYPSTVQESTPSQPTIHQTAAAHPPVTQSHHESTGLQQQHYHHQEPYRPSSPPKMAWNPAIEPPPNTAPTLNAFPSDTYFPNVWDQPPSRVHDQSIQYQSRSPSSPTPAPSAFFEPPPVPDIPQQLRHQGHYRNVTGDENHDSSPSPDPTKVKAVFPWEEQKRHRPGRVFPTYDPPSPSQFLSPEPQSSPLVQSPPAPASQPLSPLQGLPFSLTYANAWDTVPSIQKYANRLVRPPQPPPLAPAFDSKDWKKRGGGRSWDERTEASSRDGDDEDEGEDEEEPRHPGRWTDDSDNESSTNQSRSRGSSVSSSYAIKGKKKEYRVRGVQTISPVMRSQGVQVAIATQPTRNQRPSAIPLPATVNQVSGGADVSMTTAFPSPSGGSPREFVFPDAPATVRPAAVSTPPPRARRDTDSSSITRQSSNDGSSLASPPSSTGPLSPPEGQSLPELPPVRKPAGRVFDPARGIELFKRGSEEVLARFLKMSSWEEDPTQAQATN